MDRQQTLIDPRGPAERTVGAALRGRPAWNSVLGRWRVAEIEFDAGRPRRAAPTENTLIERNI